MIKPYYETEYGKLYHADCLDVMREIEDKSIDLVLTDPPYGLGDKLLNGGKTGVVKFHIQYENTKWIDEKPDRKVFDELFRISKNQIIWGGNYFDCIARKYICNNDPDKKHPTQKPLTLARWILHNYAESGQTIIDPFSGSGTFLLACEELGYKWIGIEKEKDYCDTIVNRLENITRNLF